MSPAELTDLERANLQAIRRRCGEAIRAVTNPNLSMAEVLIAVRESAADVPDLLEMIDKESHA